MSRPWIEVPVHIGIHSLIALSYTPRSRPIVLRANSRTLPTHGVYLFESHLELDVTGMQTPFLLLVIVLQKRQAFGTYFYYFTHKI